MKPFHKSIAFIVVLSLLCTASPVVQAKKIKHHHKNDHSAKIGFDGVTLDNINIDFEDSILKVTNTDENTSFKIDEKYELYINGELISTTPEQKQLTKEMYTSIDMIIEEAKDIGWDGAKIGAEGAKLGLQAILCVFKLISPNYDSDDLESEINAKAKNLEKKAEKIEIRADHIEDMARDLETLTDVMREKIPELKRLSWF